MDKDLREAALAAFKKSASEAARRHIDKAEEPAAEIVPAEAEAPVPDKPEAGTAQPVEPTVEIDGADAKASTSKMASTAQPQAGAGSTSAAAARTAAARAAGGTQRRRIERPQAGKSSRAAAAGGSRLMLLLNLLLLGLLVAALIIMAATSNALSNVREQLAVQQRGLKTQADQITAMRENLEQTYKFSRFKTGVYNDPQKGLQGVILVLDADGKVVRTRLFPISPD